LSITIDLYLCDVNSNKEEDRNKSTKDKKIIVKNAVRNTAKETEGYEKPMDKHAMNKRTNDDD